MAGRRGAGEGSITQRKDGRWEGKIDLGYVNGKRKRVSIYGKTRSEVRDKMTKALNDKQRGLPVHFERQTVEQFMHDWLEHTVKPNRRPKTYISYEQLTRLYIAPALGPIRFR